MLVTTKAIVLNTSKYSDTSLIVRCYTEELGFVSYLVKGIFKAKKGNLKPSFFQPLNQLEMVVSSRNKDTLEYIREAKVSYHYQNLQYDMSKNAQACFLADICRIILSQEPSNKQLYHFLEIAFQELDKVDYSADFHLKFLMELTQFLGFYPGLPQSDEDCFYIEEGSYGFYNIGDKNTLTDELFISFVELITEDDFRVKLKIRKEQRNQLLQKILMYYEWHLPGFRPPTSLVVLQSLFS